MLSCVKGIIEVDDKNGKAFGGNGREGINRVGRPDKKLPAIRAEHGPVYGKLRTLREKLEHPAIIGTQVLCGIFARHMQNLCISDIGLDIVKLHDHVRNPLSPPPDGRASVLRREERGQRAYR